MLYFSQTGDGVMLQTIKLSSHKTSMAKYFNFAFNYKIKRGCYETC